MWEKFTTMTTIITIITLRALRTDPSPAVRSGNSHWRVQASNLVSPCLCICALCYYLTYVSCVSLYLWVSITSYTWKVSPCMYEFLSPRWLSQGLSPLAGIPKKRPPIAPRLCTTNSIQQSQLNLIGYWVKWDAWFQLKTHPD